MRALSALLALFLASSAYAAHTVSISIDGEKYACTKVPPARCRCVAVRNGADMVVRLYPVDEANPDRYLWQSQSFQDRDNTSRVSTLKACAESMKTELSAFCQ